MLRVISLLLLAVLLNGCTFSDEQDDETKGWSQQKLYSEATRELRASNYEKAIKYYENLEARYPYGQQANQAQLNLIYAYYKHEEPELGLAAANRFIKFNPRHPAVVYAYYLRGLINFHRGSGSLLENYIPKDQAQRDPGSTLDSYKDFAIVVRDYPNTEYAEDARKRMLFLHNNLARHEVHVARFYMKRGAFLAAAKRANYVVQNYQRTPAVKPALEIMIDAYTRLGLKDLAKDAQRVLTLNLANNALIAEPQTPEAFTWAERVWSYFKLDEN